MKTTSILTFKRDFRLAAKALKYPQNNFGFHGTLVYTTLNHVETGLAQCRSVLTRMGLKFIEATGTDSFGGTYQCIQVLDDEDNTNVPVARVFGPVVIGQDSWGNPTQSQEVECPHCKRRGFKGFEMLQKGFTHKCMGCMKLVYYKTN